MVHKVILSMMLMLYFSLEAFTAFAVDTEAHPQISSVLPGADNEGLYRIKLQNPDGHAWFASL